MVSRAMQLYRTRTSDTTHSFRDEADLGYGIPAETSWYTALYLTVMSPSSVGRSRAILKTSLSCFPGDCFMSDPRLLLIIGCSILGDVDALVVGLNRVD